MSLVSLFVWGSLSCVSHPPPSVPSSALLLPTWAPALAPSGRRSLGPRRPHPRPTCSSELVSSADRVTNLQPSAVLPPGQKQEVSLCLLHLPLEA
eukprot:scaffold391_cov223-Pinguiococcus_pyrenoidosus.AAC.4